MSRTVNENLLAPGNAGRLQDAATKDLSVRQCHGKVASPDRTTNLHAAAANRHSASRHNAETAHRSTRNG